MPVTTEALAPPSTPRPEGKPSGYDTVTVTTLTGTFSGILVGACKGSVKSTIAGGIIGSAAGWGLGKTLDYFTIKPAPEPEVEPVSEPAPFKEQDISETPSTINAPSVETAALQNKQPEPPKASKTEASRAARRARERGARLALTIPTRRKTEHEIRQAITRHLKLTPVPQGDIEEGSVGKVSRWTGENGEVYAVKIIEPKSCKAHFLNHWLSPIQN